MTDETMKDLSQSFPQLLLPVHEGISKTELWSQAVRMGRPLEELRKTARELYPDDPELPDCFQTEGSAWVSEFTTSAGSVRTLRLELRQDFELALTKLSNKCEPMEILPSVGAICIRGLLDWKKINALFAEVLARGGTLADAFAQAKSDIERYRSGIVVLSSGPYSALAAEEAGFAERVWLEKSLVIRTYHEIAHFVVRGKERAVSSPVAEEVLADCIGLIAALGYYDENLASAFLGLEGKPRRIQEYADHLEEAIAQAQEAIVFMRNATVGADLSDALAFLDSLPALP